MVGVIWEVVQGVIAASWDSLVIVNCIVCAKSRRYWKLLGFFLWKYSCCT